MLPKMKPRDSMPATTVMWSFANGSASSSHAVLSASGERSRGVMSLKRIPGFGKSGTSRRKSFSCSDVHQNFTSKSGRRPENSFDS